MVLESNIVYLGEEIKNNQERLAMLEGYLREHPTVSIYKRKIYRNVYYYKKYWKNGKSVSEFLCRSKDKYQRRNKEIHESNKKRQTIKKQVQEIRQTLNALQKQLKIAKRAYKNV